MGIFVYVAYGVLAKRSVPAVDGALSRCHSCAHTAAWTKRGTPCLLCTATRSTTKYYSVARTMFWTRGLTTDGANQRNQMRHGIPSHASWRRRDEHIKLRRYRTRKVDMKDSRNTKQNCGKQKGEKKGQCQKDGRKNTYKRLPFLSADTQTCLSHCLPPFPHASGVALL